MALHLIKLAAGAAGVDELRRRVERSVALNAKDGRPAAHSCVTRLFPRRRAELVDGGSLYWVVRGAVCVRQRILDIERRLAADGVERCAILLDPALVPTEAQPRRAFQGWRYLAPGEAPNDLPRGRAAAPAALRAELAALGLL
jgi:hypothetical protein